MGNTSRELATATITLHWNSTYKKWHVRGEMIEPSGACRVWSAEARTDVSLDHATLHAIVHAVADKLEAELPF